MTTSSSPIQTLPVASVLLLISGHVQGVGYRRWMQKRAIALGLSGWVRNRRDGRVEALLIAPLQAALEAMFDACWVGPTNARVSAVSIHLLTFEAAEALTPPGAPGLAQTSGLMLLADA
jgi:acylphosphatase